MRIGGRSPPPTLDPELIRTLASLLDETGLSEIEYAAGDQRVRIVRHRAGAPAPGQPAAALPTTAPAEHPLPQGAVEPATSAGTVTAPMVGTVYLAPQPGAPPFVRLGEPVAEGQAVLIIEAMKVMNQIRAPRAGQLRKILVEDGAPVEYGQALMVIE